VPTITSPAAVQIERVMQVQIGKQTRDTLREHGLTHSRRAMEEHVMPTGCSYLTGPHRLDLTDHVCQVETTVACPPIRSPMTSTGSTG
jgi:hypothetical protein